jgi:rubrerythrin
MTEGNRADAQPTQGGPLSRKKFLAGSAAALAGGALMAVPGMAKAHTTPEPPRDIDVLNYALTLEHLEYAFYRDGLEKFGERELENARVFDGLGRYLRRRVRENFVRIRNHEKTHVETLESVIRDLGGTPVPEATYNFKTTAFTSVAKFVSVAQFLENTGVTAYDGAIAHIEAAPLLTAGATIATVEARHASYLNLLNRDVPFPDAFDEPVAPRAICEAVQAENGGFIVSTPEPYGPYYTLDYLCRKLPDTVTPS